MNDVEKKWPVELTAYQTSDGQLHASKSWAEHWQDRLDSSARATEMLVSGESLGRALRENGFIFDHESYAPLYEVFSSTKLAIPHWQLRDEPGYSPVTIKPDGSIYVYGNVGSWSGSYGDDCSPADIVRYWEQTKAASRKERR